MHRLFIRAEKILFLRLCQDHISLPECRRRSQKMSEILRRIAVQRLFPVDQAASKIRRAGDSRIDQKIGVVQFRVDSAAVRDALLQLFRSFAPAVQTFPDQMFYRIRSKIRFLVYALHLLTFIQNFHQRMF